MKSFAQFIKTTILGGLIFLVPLVVVTVVLAKAHEVMSKVAKPFSALIPLDTVGGVAIANLLAILAILLCCLIVGMLAKGDTAKRLLKSTEEKLLVIPAYAFVKGVTDSLISSEEAAKAFIPVIVKFDDNAQMAFEIERSEEGNVVIYLPGSPNPWSGSMVYFKEDRVERLDMSVPDAINNIRHLGRGSAKLGDPVQRT
ncbi:MAG: DUF502 domain-containing protein [Verrucomicrobia bacterium]|jgi:uncharacterized membrane protein|nr:DUF502 domain-containing protein [Verrucomicrobiota bacterium]